MHLTSNSPPEVLYVFGGEKAQGAEIVIERLICCNKDVCAHLIISPGDFAGKLISANKPYKITPLADLKKLNRSSTGKLTYYLKALRNYTNVPAKVYTYIKQNKIQAIHVNTIVPSFYLLPLVAYCKLVRPQLKWYWSDHDMRYFTALESRIGKLCARLYNKTIVVSNAVKAKYGFNPKVVVLYNGLDPDVFKPDLERRKNFRVRHGIADSTMVVGMAAVITPDKGQLSLINAIKELKAYNDVVLLLAGGFAADTPQYSHAVKQEFDNNVEVKYLGFIEDMTSFYNGCDIIVNNSSNSRSESLGTSIYEAMACEKIVIASSTGGTPEIITDEEDGFLFEPDNEEDLLRVLKHVLSQFYDINYIRIAARQKVVSKFNIQTMITNYNYLLQS